MEQLPVNRSYDFHQFTQKDDKQPKGDCEQGQLLLLEKTGEKVPVQLTREDCLGSHRD